MLPGRRPSVPVLRRRDGERPLSTLFPRRTSGTCHRKLLGWALTAASGIRARKPLGYIVHALR